MQRVFANLLGVWRKSEGYARRSDFCIKNIKLCQMAIEAPRCGAFLFQEVVVENPPLTPNPLAF